MSKTDEIILVTGATGTQGGGVARALLAGGHRVRALTRTSGSEAARALAEQGAEIAEGDMEDVASLATAMRGAVSVFSVQRPDMDDSDSERRHGSALIDAARQAGVRHFVHSSVCQSGEHESFPRWDEGYWAKRYWTDKADVEEAVRTAGFAAWTILRPTFIMENFRPAKARFLYPQLSHGELLSPVLPNAEVQLIAADDIGALARLVLENPNRFAGRTIDMVSDTLTMDEIAVILTAETGSAVRARSVSPQEALDAGLADRWVRSQEWINDVGYQADATAMSEAGVAPTAFATWVRRHEAELAAAT